MRKMCVEKARENRAEWWEIVGRNLDFVKSN